MIPKKLVAGSFRGRRIQLALGYSSGARILTTLVNILIVPVLTGYLGREGFGLNVTIVSTLAWINLGNFGISQGIQMTLARVFVTEPPENQRRLTSSAFALLTTAGFVVATVFLLVYPHVPWTSVFPTESVDLQEQTALAVLISVMGLTFFLPISVIPALMNARQDTHLSTIFYSCLTLTTSLGSLAGCLLDGGLVGVVTGNVVGNLIGGYLFSLFYLFPRERRIMVPHPKYTSIPSIIILLRRSAPFTLIQICVLLLMQTDNFIIMHFIAASEVTSYNVGHRFYMLIYSLFAMLIQPLWAAYTNAQIHGDFDWIRRTHRRMVRLYAIVLPVAILGVLLFSRDLMILWVGESIAPTTKLTFLLGGLYGLRIWTDIHGLLINALSQTRRILFNAFLHPVITLVGYALLVRPFGVNGMALGAIIGYAACIAWYAPLLANRILKEEPKAS